MTSKQRAYLKSLAMTMDPVLQIGKFSMTPELTGAVQEALDANPDIVAKIKGGKVQAAGALVGAVMKATRGQADAARVRELIMEMVGA